MTNRALLGLLLAAIATSIMAAPLPVQAAGAIDGWKLQQWLRIGGDVELCISKSAMRMTISKSKLVLLASAPWKDAYIYCKNTGRIYKTPFSKIASPYLGAMALWDGGVTTQVKVIPAKQEEMVGIKCQVLSEPPGQQKRLTELFRKGDLTGRAPGKLKYRVTDQLKTPPQIGAALARFYALPETQSVPLEFNCTTVSGDKNEELKTYACKPTKFSEADFALPKGLKEVNDARLVLVPDSSEEGNGIDLMMMSRSGVK